MRRLCYLAGWFFAAVSTLAKGPAGFGLPMLVTFTYLCASRPSEETVRAAAAHRARAHAVRDRQRPARHPRGGAALVRGHVRAPRQPVHRPAHLPRHVQPRVPPRPRHQRGRRHELPLLPVAARLRALPVDGARAARAVVVAAPGDAEGRGRARRHLGAPLHVVRLRLRPVLVHGHEVPPLHLPGGAAGRDAHRHRARRHARASRSPAKGAGFVGVPRGAARAACRCWCSASRACCRDRSWGTKPDGHLADPLAADGPRADRGGRGGGRRHGDGCSASPLARAEGRRRQRSRTRTAHVSRMLARGRGGRRPLLVLVGARSHHQARERRPARSHPAAAAVHVQLPARLARLARLLGGARRASRRWRSWSRLALAVRRVRQHAVVAMCAFGVRVGRLGARRLHGEDGAALGPARGHRGVLRRPRSRPTRCSSPTR